MILDKVISELAGTGEIVSLAYNGGRIPGAERQVVILSLSGDNIVLIDEETGTQKTFKKSKILWIQDSFGERVVNESANKEFVRIQALPKYDTFRNYVSSLEKKYLSEGWFIHIDENMFGVGTYYKNGKPKKTPSVAISYYEDMKRPWRVDSWRFKQGKTFSKLQSAMDVFLLKKLIIVIPKMQKECLQVTDFIIDLNMNESLRILGRPHELRTLSGDVRSDHQRPPRCGASGDSAVRPSGDRDCRESVEKATVRS